MKAACAALAALALLWAPAARAQGTCGAPVPAAAQRAWPAPLDRAVSFRARDVSLREALDRLSAAARVRLSYSSDLLPLGRRVCVVAREEALGAALARLLAGTGVEATVVSGQVVLAPARTGQPTSPEGHVTDRVNALDAIVVTGSAAGSERRSVTVGLDVVDGHRLARRGAESLADVLNASVPGVWAWRQAPSALVAQYGSVRGASSFGATYPKVYVDGVEAANPLLVTELDPDDVERVEVIRGPQGAALYGSDAISGVINIVTRHEGAGGGAARAQLRSMVGMAGSAYAAHPATWDHRLSLRTGSNLGSAGLALRVGRTGAIFPGAETRRISAAGDARRVTRNAILNASLRVSDRRSGVGTNPLLAGLPTALPAAADSVDGQSVRLYTLATSATIATDGPWTHTVLFGIDGYRLDFVPESVIPFPLANDAGLNVARGGGDRGTFRASSTLRLGDAEAETQGAVTLAVEHSVLRQETGVSQSSSAPQQQQPYTARHEVRVAGPEQTVTEWRHDTGVMAQASGSWRNAFFGTAGVRLENSDGFAGGGGISTLPMLGAAWVQRLGGGTELKLRTAFGRGIRPPRTPARDHMRWHDRWAATLLGPETQSGIEVGAELYVGSSVSLQATRFDQRASGLIQDVAVRVDTFVQGGRQVWRVGYELQNVGAIDNRGWEMQGSYAAGPLSLSAALATVDSRVRRLATGYLGDLQPGDRVLGVPGRTASLTAEWEGGGWSGAVTASRAWDWINYDRLALASAFADTTGTRRVDGPALRRFWRAYDGATDLRATVSRQLRPGIWLVAKGENLLGTQTGEPDNLTIRAGRSLMLGARADF
ncbi:MAG TPA: TonB-dependent receptor plug domain-containing protein [Longimicrobium sp.]|nr:TonB-dependent receptor plug domain-containing protein [Longimicrobium sp.]